jgi:hypothetical protein
LLFKYRKPPGHQIGLAKIESLHGILVLKQLTQRTKREYAANFSTETLKEIP